MIDKQQDWKWEEDRAHERRQRQRRKHRREKLLALQEKKAVAAAMGAEVPSGTAGFTLCLSVLCMRSKAWLVARVPLRLARLPCTASSV